MPDPRRFAQTDANRIAERWHRIARKLETGMLVEFLRKAPDYNARGYPSQTMGGQGGAENCNCRSGDACAHGTATERAALGRDVFQDVDQRGWSALMEGDGHLVALERLMALVLPDADEVERLTGRKNSTEACSGCKRVITNVGSDRVRRIDGLPYCDTCRKKHQRAS